jgi:hypothetical protein
MAATTISRSTWTDGISGTILSNARLQGDVYDKIDALIAANITFGGTISSEAFGTHSHSAGGSGSNLILVRNSTAGTSNKGVFQAQADGAGVMALEMFSSTHTPNGSGSVTAAGGRLVLSGAGHLGIETVTGDVRFFPAGALRVRVDFTSGLIAENDYGLRIKNTGGTAIDGVIITSGNEMRIGSESAASVVDTVIKAGAAVRFRMNSAERVVLTAAGSVQASDGSVSAPGLGFKDDADTGLYRLGAGRIGAALDGVQGIAVNKPGTTAAWGNEIDVVAGDFGAGSGGSMIRVGRNTNGAGAPGFVDLRDKNGGHNAIWSDSSRVLRIGDAPDVGDGDTTGTIVGTQTSSRDSKDVLGLFIDRPSALRTVLDTPLFRWRYKPGHGIQGEEFIGIITDDSPAFGMDRDEAHPGGKSLNVANAIGLLIASVQELQLQVNAMRKAA